MHKPSVLSSIPIGRRVCLQKINAGHRITHRLTELGLTPGVEFSIIQNGGGPLLISVRGSRIAIGRGMANKIMVIPIEAQISFQNKPRIYEVVKSQNENATRRFDR